MPDASALPKSARLRDDYDEPPEADAGLEERLWAALDRSVGLLEARLDALVKQGYPNLAAEDTAAVRNIAETLDRLGLLKPPPPPVEAPEPDPSEVWIAASEIGWPTYDCDELVVRLRERYEGRA